MSEFSSEPILSVSLPIYNGENHMREALDSILNQTFRDFELIISDNASTDATQEICEDYASRDSRIRYYRNDENIGATSNFIRAFELSKGKYFKWVGHDDILDPTLLEKCLNALIDREEDGYVCCWPNTIVIDVNSEFVRKVVEPPMKLESDVLHERFRDGTYAHHSSFQFYGIIRSDVLRETCVMGPWICSDYTVIGQLAMRGKIYLHPEYLHKRRYQSRDGYESYEEDFYSYAKFWVHPSKKDDILLPYWKMAYEAGKGVMKAPMPITDRIMCLWHVASSRHRLGRGFSQYFRDIVHAFKELMQKLFGSKD
jgi:glycosyltransferase involved in cell wall biosynthesis